MITTYIPLPLDILSLNDSCHVTHISIGDPTFEEDCMIYGVGRSLARNTGCVGGRPRRSPCRCNQSHIMHSSHVYLHLSISRLGLEPLHNLQA